MRCHDIKWDVPFFSSPRCHLEIKPCHVKSFLSLFDVFDTVHSQKMTKSRDYIICEDCDQLSNKSAKAADWASISVPPIRNDSYPIRNVPTCMCIIHRARKIRGQVLILVCNDNRICPHPSGIKNVVIP